MKIDLKNNYSTCIADFQKDTGLQVKGNEALYLSYINFRANDSTHQMQWHIANLLLNLPDKIGFVISTKK